MATAQIKKVWKIGGSLAIVLPNKGAENTKAKKAGLQGTK